MNSIRIIEINKDSSYMAQIEDLFAQLYNYMNSTGLQMPLINGGEKLWRKSIEKIIGGRFGMLIGAIEEERVIGFAQGTIRFSADYMGSLKVGFITNIFISPEFRSKGLGKNLVSNLEEWFKSKDVHSYELQVLSGNINGIGFWESIGYKRELLQMRKIR